MGYKYFSKREQITGEIKRILDSEITTFKYGALKGEFMIKYSTSDGIIDSVLNAFVLSGRITLDKTKDEIVNIEAKKIKDRHINDEINEVFGERIANEHP